jgi:5'(3')-deoxyribonucleotidase
MLRPSKYFCRKILRKNWRFFKTIIPNIDHSNVFQDKRQFFRQKFPTIADLKVLCTQNTIFMLHHVMQHGYETVTVDPNLGRYMKIMLHVHKQCCSLVAKSGSV